MSARFLGPPVYDGYLNVFALPLVAKLAEVGARRARVVELEGQAHSRAEAPV
jgi:hypothetical protein